MNNYDDLFNRSTNRESLVDQKTEEKIDTLEGIFKNSVNFEENTISLGSYDDSLYSSKSEKTNNNSAGFGFSDSVQRNEPSIDPLEQTGKISEVDLETLRNYSKMIHEVIDEPKEEVQSSSQAYGGKQKVLSTNRPNYSNNPDDIPKNNDGKEILTAFVSCSILSFVTAGMGVGWLLYIIMHI